MMVSMGPATSLLINIPSPLAKLKQKCTLVAQAFALRSFTTVKVVFPMSLLLNLSHRVSIMNML